MTAYAHCQSDQFRETRSKITGHHLLANLSYHKVLVPAGMNLDLAKELGAELSTRWEQLGAIGGKSRKTTPETRAAYDAFAEVQAVDDFMSAIDGILSLASGAKSPRAAVLRALVWLTRLWAHGLVAIAPKWTTEFKVNCPVSEFTVGGHLGWLEEVEAVASLKSEREARRAKGLILRIATTAVGVKDLGDLTPTTTAETIRKHMGTRNPGIVRALLHAQQRRYGAATCFTHTDWGVMRFTRTRSDPAFRWATQEDPTLEPWRNYIAQWFAERPVKSQAFKLGEFLLNYLLANPAVTRNPEEFCRRNYRPSTPYRDWVERRNRSSRALFDNNNLGSEFIDWLLDAHLSAPDDDGRPVRSPIHWNPIPRMHRKQQAIQTHRVAIPTRFIRELIRILVEDDFAWPKSKRNDWLPWFNPDTGQWEEIWSPVRACALLLKLHLPLRTYQVRMLDSGEGDSERFMNGRWVGNTGPLAPPEGSVVRRGFLRKYVDPVSGQTYTGFYVNTNKTQDRGRDETDRGYEIPWQHEGVIEVAADLLRWQERYNPIPAPQCWADMHDHMLYRSGRCGEFARRDQVCFLFRDPHGTYHNEPLTDGRLRTYWIALLDELERRVAARGETLADGSPIAFIASRNPSTGTPLRPVYDLHSLRVSLITALAIEGGVPIQILSRCIAGHASILMTLYYVKPGASQITEILTEAQKKIDLEEQRNLIHFLRSAEYKTLASAVASNDRSGLTALHETPTGSWIVGQTGICPVGGTLCDKGGPKLSSNPQLSDYAPTPGGPRNCSRCRFFITGPAFLGGLAAHFNATGFRLLTAAERYRAEEAAIQKLEDEIVQTDEPARQLSLMADFNAAHDRHLSRMREVDDLAHNLHAIFRLTDRCKAIAAEARAGPSDGMNLVLAGQKADFEAAIQVTTNFELMNAVCQSARIYPATDSTVANLRRARILDGMLERNGYRPLFATLSEEEALAAGNEFVNLLIRQYGNADAVAVVEGKRMLDAAGIVADMERSLGNKSTKPIELTDSFREFRNNLPAPAAPRDAST